jgi:predicted  nucleic acid-binding Zn-ribbon protein
MASQTNATVETLRKLHRIHRQLNDLNERLQRGPRVAQAHQANAERLESQLEALKKEALVLRMATDDKQNQLASGEQSVEKRRIQLRAAASNREFQALQDEIAAAAKANEVLEIEILEAMEKLDDYERRLEESQAALAKGREEAEKYAGEVSEAEPRIRGDLERLRADLAQSEADLPGDFREIYRRVTRQKGEDALASVQGEFCAGCNQHVPVNLINELMLNRPAVCRSCGRLLYLPEDYSPK